jgi:hypothetical protein
MSGIKDLKIKIKYFNDILFNNKRFELRLNDKNFSVYDVIILREYDSDKKRYTYFSENKIVVRIIYVLKNVEKYGLNKDYCIFGFEILFKQDFERLREKRLKIKFNKEVI